MWWMFLHESWLSKNTKHIYTVSNHVLKWTVWVPEVGKLWVHTSPVLCNWNLPAQSYARFSKPTNPKQDPLVQTNANGFNIPETNVSKESSSPNFSKCLCVTIPLTNVPHLQVEVTSNLSSLNSVLKHLKTEAGNKLELASGSPPKVALRRQKPMRCQSESVTRPVMREYKDRITSSCSWDLNW